MATVKLQALQSCSVIRIGSETYKSGADGTISVPEKQVDVLIQSHGFKSLSAAYDRAKLREKIYGKTTTGMDPTR